MTERSAAAEFAYLHRLPPREALAYLQGRDRLTLTYSWQDLWQAEHAQQFTVSRLANLDILKAMQDGITASVNGDLSRRDWMRDMKGLLQKEGWWGEREVLDPETGEVVTTKFDSARLKLIFDTNTRQAYSAGNWQQIEAVKKTFPYVRYITKRDDRVRAAHQAWDNLTLPVDDPFWDTHNPPCDFRCRCRVTNMTAAEYERRQGAGTIKTEAPPEVMREFVNRRTGEITQAPVGVNPGFAYNVGKAGARAQELARIAGEKIAASQLPDAIAEKFLQDMSLPVTPSPGSLEEFIAAGKKITDSLPTTEPMEMLAALKLRLKNEPGTDRECTIVNEGAGADLVRLASTAYPASWVEAADNHGPLYAKLGTADRGGHWSADHQQYPVGARVELPAFGVVTVEQNVGYVVVRDLGNAAHEYAHRLQTALPGLQEKFAELHQRRTLGDALESLKTLEPMLNYSPDEMTRKDHYITPFWGKDYGGEPMEVMSMAMETVLSGKNLARLYNEDREMFDFVVGLLFHWKP